jgi:DNA processing protein
MRNYSDDQKARLLLMSAMEGGYIFWTKEVREFGARYVVERFKDGFYKGGKYSADKISVHLLETNADKLIEELNLAHSVLITPESAEWPQQLEDLSAPPYGLIGRGDISLLGQRSLSIVGSRNPSSYGVRIAGEFAAGFADLDWVVVSGGAYGIDSAAHKGAIVAEGGTIAVLGSGTAQIYPSGNDRLFKEIETHGLLLSEVLPHVHAHPTRFLIRNRLIAALSRVTLVVEAAYRSGSLRTARDAAEIMRVVMAIPGAITSPASEGCHKLIANHEAELVSSVGDVMELVMRLDDARMDA